MITTAYEKLSVKLPYRHVAAVSAQDRRQEMLGNGEFNFSKTVHFLLFLLLVAILTLIHSPVALRLPYLPEVGDIASRNIKANRDLLIEDQYTTIKRRQEAAAAIPPVYEWDTGMIDLVISQLDESLEWLEASRDKKKPAILPNMDVQQQEATPKSEEKTSFLPDAHHDAQRYAFSQGLEEEVLEGDYQALLALPKLGPLITAIQNWLTNIDKPLMVGSPEVLAELSRVPFYVVSSVAEGSEKQVSGTAGVLDLEGMRNLLSESISQWLGDFPPEVRQWLLAETRTQIRPNLVLNVAETQARRKLAFDAVETVFFQARNGQMVVREGAVVTKAIRMKLEAMHQNQWTDAVLWRILGLATMLGSLIWMGRWFLVKTSTTFPQDRKTFYLLGCILLISSLLSVFTFTIGQGMMELLNLSSHMVMYLPQAALGSALASLTVGARAGIPGGALLLGVILAFLGALVTNGGLPLFIYYIVGSLVGAATLRTCRRRFDVLYCGVKIGVAQMLVMPLVEILSGNYYPTWYWLLGMAMAMASGLIAGLWGLALIPLLESLFNITTDSRLTELASGDHPLIRELSLRSPGTYHHSVMMGNLTEAAAESINANPLLARVMALYHDIGKMNSPHYFVENQSDENRHDHLTPSMSMKVIVAHVKGGQELARKYKLGGLIKEAIASHHGTSLLQYFYNRAVNQAATRHETVQEEEYRYPGPKPRCREAGILMLADSVEAAARSMKSPVPAQIQALVRRIVDSRISDGQLDECTLTLQEMAHIEEAFTRVLTLGFYHHRIAYPNQTDTPQKKPRAHGKNNNNVRAQPLANK